MSTVIKSLVCPSTIAMEARVKTSTGCTVQLLMLDNELWMHSICCILRHRHIVCIWRWRNVIHVTWTVLHFDYSDNLFYPKDF